MILFIELCFTIKGMYKKKSNVKDIMFNHKH